MTRFEKGLQGSELWPPYLAARNEVELYPEGPQEPSSELAYIEWDEERQIDWAVRYWEKARGARLPVGEDFAGFWRDFEWMGVQRQLKVLGIFARLNHRDGKAAYVDDMPRVLRYLRGACARYRALAPLRSLLDELHGDGGPVGSAP